MANLLNKAYVYFLISKLTNRYDRLKKAYAQSLKMAETSFELRYEMKIYLGDAISILDYCAQDIANIFCEISNNDQIAFPIVYKEKYMNTRGFNELAKHRLKGLQKLHPKIFEYLESIQGYHKGFEWMADVATLNNQHKHVQLVPQLQVEIPELRMEHNGASITLRGNENKLFIPSGANAKLGDASIHGGQKITADSQSIACDERINIKRQIWKDLIFDKTDISVLSLIEKVNKNLPTIVGDIYKFLSP